MKKIINNETGLAHIALAAILVVVALAGVAGLRVYSVQQERKLEQTARASQAEMDKELEASLKAKESAKPAETEVVVPEEIDEAKPQPSESTQPVAEKPASSPTTQKPAQPKPDSTKPAMTKVIVSNPSVSVEDQQVVFTSTLSGSYAGNCKVYLKKEGDKSGTWHYDESAAPRSTCVSSVSRAQLSAGKWYFELAFMGNGIYSQNASGSFSL